MDFTIDTEQIRRQGRILEKTAELMKTMTDNMAWKMRLPEYERLMLGDAIRQHQIQQIGCTPEEFEEMLRISGKSNSIEEFYKDKAPHIRLLNSNGLVAPESEYDANLTKEMAYSTYLGIDREYALAVASKIDEAHSSGVFYTKQIREAYTGNLAQQLGMSEALYKIKASEKNAATLSSSSLPQVQETSAPKFGGP